MNRNHATVMMDIDLIQSFLSKLIQDVRQLQMVKYPGSSDEGGGHGRKYQSIH